MSTRSNSCMSRTSPTPRRLAATADTLTQPVYNVSGGRQITVAETARLLAELLPGSHYDIGSGFLPDWDRQGPYDLSASTRDLGYTPGLGLSSGVSTARSIGSVRREWPNDLR